MYRSQAPMGDFVEMRYWCGSRLWRCRIKRVSSCALTSEQKAIIAEKMGLVSDELVLTSLSSTQDVAQIEDIGENLFLAASKTFTVS